MVLVPTMKVATLHARVVLAAMSLAALLVLAWTLASPAAAQENDTQDASGQREQSVQGSGQQAGDAAQREDEQDVDPLEGKTANIAADSIGPIAVADCEATAGETASITVADPDDAATSETFTGGTDAVFQFGAQGVTINAEGGGNLDRANLKGLRTGEVVSSEGISCESGGAQRAADETREDDNLENLSCDDLLVLFRADGNGQYGDASNLADSDVRSRIEVCLKKEIVNNPGGNLPNTGGLSLIGLAALGAAAAVVGLSVIRGGRR